MASMEKAWTQKEKSDTFRNWPQQWCERRISSLTSGETAYSIGRSAFQL